MGGTLNWVIRDATGSVRCFTGWTNTLPTGMLTPAFARGENAGIEYAIGKITDGKQKSDGLHPSGYGLIVTDFMTGSILSMQGYTDLTRILAFSNVYADMDSHHAQLRKLSEAGLITSYELTISRKDVEFFLETHGASVEWLNASFATATFPGERSYDEVTEIERTAREKFELVFPRDVRSEDDPRLLEYLKVHQAASEEERKPAFPSCGQANLSLGGLAIIDFDETAEGGREMLSELRNLGFDLSQAEEEAWAGWIQNLEEDEIEDEVQP